ncbi:hypothetical protein IGI04_012510, partial [Brassica rapa subsp. trilocularis]
MNCYIVPAQEDSIPILAKETKTPNSETLATVNPAVPSIQDQTLQKMEKKAMGTKTVEPLPTIASKGKDTGSKELAAITCSSAPAIADYPASEQSDHTVSVNHNLSKGSLYVDLSTDRDLPEQQSSTASSSDTSTSADDGDPDDDSDGFIEYFSKRHQK